MRAITALILLGFVAVSGGALAQQKTPSNHLSGAGSLYLQQHQNNAVDWYPWGREAIDKAHNEGKIIFLSVGYSSCHWCHVMREETFENQEVGDYMNQHFVSIKIDREERPDLDAQFGLATMFMTGASGWPNSVFLTPLGDPFFGGGYFPREDFLGVAEMIVDVWGHEAGAVRAQGFTIANRIQGFLDQEAAIGDVSEQDVLTAAKALLGGFDEFHGGFGVAPKFPRETVLLFLLDQAARYGDRELLNVVTTTLDGMIAGGIYDHVGGGFHRYSVDPDWHVPHFEKMLYNQALIARVLVRAYGLTGRNDYARVAGETLDFVLREMTAPQGGFYASQDADSIWEDGETYEGAFYLWTQEQMVTALKGFSDADISAMIDISGLADASGVFEAPFERADVIRRLGSGGLSRNKISTMFEALRVARAQRRAPVTDRKIILSWNGMMIATLAEASGVLGRPEFRAAAEKAALFAWETMKGPQGFQRLFVDEIATTEAQLPDLVEFGLGLVALADFDSGPKNDFGAPWLAKAQSIRAALMDGFYDVGAAMRMTRTRQGFSIFRPIEDQPLPSGNAGALSFLSKFDNRFGVISEETNGLAATLAKDATLAPMQRAAMLEAVAQFKGRARGAMRRSTGGVVKVLASLDKTQNKIDFRIEIKDGWHINGHVPLEAYFIATSVSVSTSVNGAQGDVRYPDPLIKSLGFNDKPLALYEGLIDLSVPFRADRDEMVRALLEIQACSDEVCLQPDEMVFHFWP